MSPRPPNKSATGHFAQGRIQDFGRGGGGGNAAFHVAIYLNKKQSELYK